MPLINTYTDKNSALERSLNSNRCKADVKSTYMYLNSRDFVLSIGENKESKHFHPGTFHDQAF